MPHEPDWKQSIDPVLLARLLRPLSAPGLFSQALVRRIVGWVEYFSGRLPLLESISRRQGRSGGLRSEEVPIVYGRWVEPRQDASTFTSTVVHERIVVHALPARPAPPSMPGREADTGRPVHPSTSPAGQSHPVVTPSRPTGEASAPHVPLPHLAASQDPSQASSSAPLAQQQPPPGQAVDTRGPTRSPTSLAGQPHPVVTPSRPASAAAIPQTPLALLATAPALSQTLPAASEPQPLPGRESDVGRPVQPFTSPSGQPGPVVTPSSSRPASEASAPHAPLPHLAAPPALSPTPSEPRPLPGREADVGRPVQPLPVVKPSVTAVGARASFTPVSHPVKPALTPALPRGEAARPVVSPLPPAQRPRAMAGATPDPSLPRVAPLPRTAPADMPSPATPLPHRRLAGPPLPADTGGDASTSPAAFPPRAPSPPAGAAPAVVSSPAAPWLPATSLVAPAPSSTVDLESLADKVQRKLLRRLTAERERKGGSR